LIGSPLINTPVSLEQNYPNPFNPTTRIKFSVQEFSFVTLKVFDILGREVATLVCEPKPAGEYEVEFNSLSASVGQGLSSGIYIYQLQAGNRPDGNAGFVETRKMMLLK